MGTVIIGAFAAAWLTGITALAPSHAAPHAGAYAQPHAMPQPHTQMPAMPHAQPDVPGVIPSVQDSATTSFEVGGVRIIHRRLSANELVAVNLYVLGGSAQLNAGNAGIELMLLRASEFGTEAYPGRSVRTATAWTGSRMFVYGEPDWSVIGFRGVRADFDSTWNILADRVMRPSLDPASIELVRARMLRSARSRTSHPDARITALADSVAFRGHVYANEPDGTEASLSAITADMLREYHAAQMVTSRMLLVVVGNVTRPELEAAVARTLAQLPRGDYAWSLPPVWAPGRASVTPISQQLPTNYVLGYFAGPQSNSRDYAAFRIATRILGGIAASMIRDAGLSYAPAAPFLERGASGGGIYVTTARPDSTMKVFNTSIEFLRENTVRRAVLQRYLRGFITEFYAENESVGGQADFLARYELLRGDWRSSGNYMNELRAIEGIDIRRVARQYMRNIQYVYIGNTSSVPTAVMTKF